MIGRKLTVLSLNTVQTKIWQKIPKKGGFSPPRTPTVWMYVIWTWLVWKTLPELRFHHYSICRCR